MKKILTIIGTRPETIKLAPVIQALKDTGDGFASVVCVTGQHRGLLDQMLSHFEIAPDFDLDLMEPDQQLPLLTSKAVLKISAVIEEVRPDATLVQGDTTTAMVAGLASFYAQVPVGHVEAGLRTDSRYNPFPEEINRRLLSVLATLNFAPTETAARALRSEGHAAGDIYVTGNTVIDALLWTAARIEKPFAGAELRQPRYVLVTAHRRENFGRPIREICAALEIIAARGDVDIVYPVHPNPNIRAPVHSLLGGLKNVHLIEPLEYPDFVAAMRDACLLLTDSGGIQEEATALGKPVLVMRETTERPEAVEAGVARLVGTATEGIVTNVETLLDDPGSHRAMARASSPYGDGAAGRRIVEILKQRL